MPVEMKYYYYDRDRELRGPSELDFLVREVKWGGLPEYLMVRPENGDDWVPLLEVVKEDMSVKLAVNVMSLAPEEVVRLPRWKRFWYYYRRSWKMAFVFAGRASRRECLSVFLTMTLVNFLALLIVPMFSGIVLSLLFSVKEMVSFLVPVTVLVTVLVFLAVSFQSFSLCWRRFHDLSLPGYWAFALPVFVYAGNGLFGELFARVSQSDPVHRIMVHPENVFLLILSVVFLLVFVVLLTWVVALLGMFPGSGEENEYGPPPRV